jgi:hypothetical protein
MKKTMIISPIIVLTAIAFAIALAAIGTSQLVHAQTNKTSAGATNATTSGSNVTGPTNTTNKTNIGTASQIENLTKGNAGSLQNSSNIAGPSSANTSAANNTGAYNASSQNKTGNPLSNLPVIGKFFK